MAEKKQMTRTLFGVALPPRNDYKPTKWLRLSFCIPGTFMSKKNRLTADRHAGKMIKVFNEFKATNLGQPVTMEMINKLQHDILDIKPIVRPTKAYLRWQEKVKPVFLEQAQYWKQKYEPKGLIYPITKCSISTYHYWRDPKRRDSDNRIETANDILKELGIISDDAYQVEPKGDFAASRYEGMLKHATEITLMAYEW